MSEVPKLPTVRTIRVITNSASIRHAAIKDMAHGLNFGYTPKLYRKQGVFLNIVGSGEILSLHHRIGVKPQENIREDLTNALADHMPDSFDKLIEIPVFPLVDYVSPINGMLYIQTADDPRLTEERHKAQAIIDDFFHIGQPGNPSHEEAWDEQPDAEAHLGVRIARVRTPEISAVLRQKLEEEVALLPDNLCLDGGIVETAQERLHINY